MSNQGSDSSVTVDVIVVGAGFSGCYALHRLRSIGYTVKILEAGTGFGGVWHLNHYPGARVDSEVPTYQLDIPKVWQDFNFSQRYPDHKELRNYFDHLDKTLNLSKDTIFRARVDKVRYSVEQKTWHFRTRLGLEATSKYAIFAVGASTKPFVPDLPGLQDFSGDVIHPAQWPKNFNPKSKRIGVIGQGASGLQIVKELAKQDCELLVLLRNPSMGLPMNQQALTPEFADWLRSYQDAMFSKAKYASASAYPYNVCEQSWYDASEDERLQRYEWLWSNGGFKILVSNFPEVMYDKAANADFYAFWVKKVRQRISDPRKREILAPLKQPYWVGTKRPSLEQDYYESLDRSNVRLVDLKQTPIKKLTAEGIEVGDNETNEILSVDTIVVATGYDNLTGSLFDMNIHDKAGIKLQKTWENGILTHLGMAVPGFPNAFFLYGPQAPSSLVNGPPFIEMQVDWLVELLEKAKADNIETLEASAEAAENWKRMTRAKFDQSLVRESNSWFIGANIPGKTIEPLCWFGGIPSWWESCRDALKSWEQSGFVIN